ncbi:unnamed protein product [Parajaminaea phylloscopi]
MDGHDSPLSAVTGSDSHPEAYPSVGATSPEAASPEENGKPKSTTLCDLPKEVLREVFLLCDNPKSLVGTCKAVHELSQNESLRCTWFLTRYGKCFALAQAIGRKRMFTPTLFQSLLRQGALFPRGLAQEVLKRWGKPGHRNGWACEMHVKAYLGLIEAAYDQYGTLDMTTLDHQTFESWLFGYSQQCPMHLVDQFNFVPQPFCVGDTSWIQQAITKDVSLAAKWHALGLRLSEDERTQILKGILARENRSSLNTEGDLRSRCKSIETLLSNKELGYASDTKWIEAIVHDLVKGSYEASMPSLGVRRTSTDEKLKSNFEVLRSLQGDGVITTDLYAIVIKMVRRLLRSNQAPGKHAGLMLFLAESFSSLPSALGPAWSFTLLFHHQYVKSNLRQTPDPAALDTKVKEAWQANASRISCRQVIEFMLHPFINTDLFILDLIKTHHEEKGINLVGTWPSFFEQLIKNFLLRADKGSLLSAVCDWAKRELEITLSDTALALVRSHALPMDDPTAIVGPSAFALQRKRQWTYGSPTKQLVWSETHRQCTPSPLGAIRVDENTLMGYAFPDVTVTRPATPNFLFGSALAAQDAQLVWSLPEDWLLQMCTPHLRDQTVDETSTDHFHGLVFPTIALEGSHWDPFCLVARTSACSHQAVGFVIVQQVCKAFPEAIQIIFDHALVCRASSAVLERTMYGRSWDYSLDGLAQACLTAGAQFKTYHFQVLAHLQLVLPKDFKKAFLCPNGPNHFEWEQRAVYPISSALTSAERHLAQQTYDKTKSLWQADDTGSGPLAEIYFFDAISPFDPLQSEGIRGAAITRTKKDIPIPKSKAIGAREWLPYVWSTRDRPVDRSQTAADNAQDDVAPAGTSKTETDNALMDVCLALHRARAAQKPSDTEGIILEYPGDTVRPSQVEPPDSTETDTVVQGGTHPDPNPGTTDDPMPVDSGNGAAAGNGEAEEMVDGISLSPDSLIEETDRSVSDDHSGHCDEAQSDVALGELDAPSEAVHAKDDSRGSDIHGTEQLAAVGSLPPVPRKTAIQWTKKPSMFDAIPSGDGHQVYVSIHGQPFAFTENERRRYLRNVLPLLTFLRQLCSLEARKRAYLKLCGPPSVGVEPHPFENDLRSLVKDLEGLTQTLMAAVHQSSSDKEEGDAQQMLQELLGLHDDIAAQSGGAEMISTIRESYEMDEKKRARKACIYRRAASQRRCAFRTAKYRLQRGRDKEPGLLDSEPDDDDYEPGPEPAGDADSEASSSDGESEEDGRKSTLVSKAGKKRIASKGESSRKPAQSEARAITTRSTRAAEAAGPKRSGKRKAIHPAPKAAAQGDGKKARVTRSSSGKGRAK